MFQCVIVTLKDGSCKSLCTHVLIISAGVDTVQFLCQYEFINCCWRML